jgi:hypothetical protein
MAWLGNWNSDGWSRPAGGAGAGSASEISLKTVAAGCGLPEPHPAFERLRQAPVQGEKRTVNGFSPVGIQPARNTYEIDATFEMRTRRRIWLQRCRRGATGSS